MGSSGGDARHSGRDVEALLSGFRSDVDTLIALSATAPVPNDVAGDHRIVAEGQYGFDPTAGEFDLATFLATTEPPTTEPPTTEPPTTLSLIVLAENDLLYPHEDARAVIESPPIGAARVGADHRRGVTLSRTASRGARSAS